MSGIRLSDKIRFGDKIGEINVDDVFTTLDKIKEFVEKYLETIPDLGDYDEKDIRIWGDLEKGKICIYRLR